MGNTASSPNQSYKESDDPWWSLENEDYILERPNLTDLFDFSGPISENVKLNDQELLTKEQSTTSECKENEEIQIEKLSTNREQTLEEFKEELRIKRIARQNAISDLRNEITNLKQELAKEREINIRLRNETSEIDRKDAEMCTDINIASGMQSAVDTITALCSDSDNQPASLRSQLAEVQLALQLANADNLSLTTELNVIRKQVASLKEVILCSKQMIEVREEQVTQLKAKLRQIEDSLTERELKIMSDNLRQEYDRQLANIRNLRQLYEERARVSAAERENLLRQISIKKDEVAAEIERRQKTEERVASLEQELEESYKSIDALKIERNEFKFENKSIKEEMEVINKLFTQTLMGFSRNNSLDIDRLTTMLEENRTLLNEIATKEVSTEGASLPKLLFDIVKQANNSNESDAFNIQEATANSNQQEIGKVATAQEIIGNLPKVWRVLMELLSHHKIEQVQFKENGESEDCYKSVETPTGPKVELSVSKTYIKLKDLILEKKALQKETNKLKTLNSHLERRLNEQEKRLSTVSLELTKTWHLVGKMQRQHRQLHTHEQILRYQLQQKRRLLNELKEELEHCRRKWAAARAKNAESQIQCDDLRREFAKRKLEDANTSGESGYSDGPASEEEDEASPPVPKTENLHVLFKNPRKIERRWSSSPTRTPFVEILHRGKSAPPTTTFLSELIHTTDEIAATVPLRSVASTSIVSEEPTVTVTHPPNKITRVTSGAVPKEGVKLSRHKKREKPKEKDGESLEEMFMRLSGSYSEASTPQTTQDNDDLKRSDRAERIHRLEEQCKSLIAQVIETSDCREKLEVQLCQFQNEMKPAQHPIPLENQSSSQENNKEMADNVYLTDREKEYTKNRAERLKCMEEESKQFLSKFKKINNRGEDINTAIEDVHSRSTVSDKQTGVEELESKASVAVEEKSVHLTPEEDAYTTKRSERLKRLEEESKQLLFKLNNNSVRGAKMNTKLDELHSRYGSDQGEEITSSKSVLQSETLSVNNEQSNPIQNLNAAQSVLTAKEIDYTTKRDERLKRLEQEGKELLSKLAHTSSRGTEIMNRLDGIHEQVIAKSQVEELNGNEGAQAISESGTEETTLCSKIEAVQKRLEKSKQLLSQLSSDPDFKPIPLHHQSNNHQNDIEDHSIKAEEATVVSVQSVEESNTSAENILQQTLNENETALNNSGDINESVDN